MENVHDAIAWYQKKIGSYDKQLWEQSVEKKLQKQPPFVLHNAPRKKVRLKTEYIDVDLIRGSTFTKTKPQVPWVYITRRAVSRVLFFPFYYNWWVHQTSKKLYAVLLVLYILQVVTVIVYLRNFDHSIMEDELSFTEVILPTILMFLLCLIHSQTVLAHINHKPPKRAKNISGVTRKPRPKKTSRKGRSSGNNSTCPEDGGNTDTSRSTKQRPSDPSIPEESHPSNSASEVQFQKNQDPPLSPSIDMEKNLLSRSVSDYELKPATASTHQDQPQATPSSSSHHHHHHRSHHHDHQSQQHHHHHGDSTAKDDSKSPSQLHDKRSSLQHKRTQSEDEREEEEEEVVIEKNVHSSKWGDSKASSGCHPQRTGCSYNLLDNLPNLLTVEKICVDADSPSQTEDNDGVKSERKGVSEPLCSSGNIENNSSPCGSQREREASPSSESQVCVKVITRDDSDQKGTKTVILGTNLVNGKDFEENSECKGDKEVSEVKKIPHEETESIARVECNKVISSAIENENAGNDKEKASPPVVTRDVSIEYPSGSDNPSSSDFEMVDQHVGLEPSPAASPKQINEGESSVLALNGKKIENHHFDFSNVDESQVRCEGCLSKDHKRLCDIQRAASGSQEPPCLRRRSHPMQVETQDSCDSGINNESPSCVCNGEDSHPHPVGHRRVSDLSLEMTNAPGKSELFACVNCQNICELADKDAKNSSAVSHSTLNGDIQDSHMASSSSSPSQDSSLKTVKSELCQNCAHKDDDDTPKNEYSAKGVCDAELAQPSPGKAQILVNGTHNVPQVLVRAPSLPKDCLNNIKTSSGVGQTHSVPVVSETSSQLQCFSEQFVQEILNEDTLREISCSSLLAHSDLENSSSSISHLSVASAGSYDSTSSSSCKLSSLDNIPPSKPSSATASASASSVYSLQNSPRQEQQESISSRRGFTEKIKVGSNGKQDDDRTNALDESLEQINMSDGERPSDDVSNYNPSDSDADSDGPLHEDLRNRCEEKWKRLRFQELASDGSGTATTSRANTNIMAGPSATSTATSSGKGASTSTAGSGLNSTGSRGVVGILTRKPSPLKDLAIGRKPSNSTAAINSSASDQEQNEARNQLRRRRRTSGTPAEIGESSRSRNVPNSLGLHPTDNKTRHVSSSENETGGAHTPEGSNKATMSSEEWEDRMQSDETTSSAYSSSCGNSDVDTDERGEEEKTEYTTSTLHVINLLQPGLHSGSLSPLPQQSGSPTSSGNVTQPDKVSCVIWEGNECKKVDLTALDIGWAIIDKVDSLPESSDYFFIGFMFSLIMGLIPLVFRAYANKEFMEKGWEEILSYSFVLTKIVELPFLVSNSYTWRQHLLMINGIIQRFVLSLIFFFLLTVADRTFKQRLLYAKHFSYLTSSRRARKFSMPHFRLNKVRNIKIWLSLRSYLKRRGPQRSVDVIVSACFLSAVCTVCLISLQMLKDTDGYLDFLCNWELLVWCTALGVFLMRFMTVGLKINKKYRNLSVLITEQINLYLQMEQKPHKKEELILANNVLRLAEDLLKELESPFKISGFSANPLIYNIMRVVVLSAFSAVLTEVLGFKLKLHKIKLKG